jgi:hypothetical protein
LPWNYGEKLLKHDSAKMAQSGVREALLLRGLALPGAHLTPLVGGRSNISWRVDGPGQPIVVKLFAAGSDNPLFPNDPASEVASLRHLEGTQLAPVWLDDFSTEAGHCVVYGHVPGENWQAGAAEIAALLHRVHGLIGPDHLRTVPDGSTELVRQTEAILDQCAPSDAEMLRKLQPARVIPASGRRCLLHGDPVPGNIVGTPGNWRLIDWQCPAFGDPCEDIALFLSPAMQLAYRGAPLSVGESQSFRVAYPDRDAIERYHSLAGFYHWRMAAYCLWLDSRGNCSAREGAEAEIAAMIEACP